MKSKTFWIVFWIVITVIAVLFFSNHPLHSDEGAVINIAWQMWYGKKLYVDFSEFITPGSGYFIYFVWKVFGSPSYLSIKLASVVLWLVSSVGLVIIVREFTRQKVAAALIVCTWLLSCHFYPLINHNPYSSFIAIWLTSVLLLALRKKAPYLFLLAGFFGAMTFLFLQTKGLSLSVIALILIIVIAVKEKRGWWKNSFSFVCGWLVTVVLLTLPWSADVLYHSWFTLPREVNYLGYTMYNFKLVLVELLVIAVLIVLVYRKHDLKITVLAVMQIGLYLSSAQLVDINHLMINSFPTLVVLAVLFGQYFFNDQFKPILRNSILVLLIVAFLVTCLIVIYQIFSDVNILTYDMQGQTHDGIFQQSDILAADNVYFGPFLPGWYFEIGKENHFTTAANMTLCPGECQQETVEILKKVQPEFAMMNYSIVQKFNYSQDNLIDQYIQNNYQLCEYRTGPLQVYALHNCPSAE